MKAIIQPNNEYSSRRGQKREWKRCEKYVREEKPLTKLISGIVELPTKEETIGMKHRSVDCR